MLKTTDATNIKLYLEKVEEKEGKEKSPKKTIDDVTSKSKLA